MGVTAALAAVSLIGSAYSADKQRKAANTANDQMRENATKTSQEQDRQVNKANAKAPDVNALLSAAQQQAAGGPGSTMLTGPAGVDPGQLTLGKSTLLGGS
jgi:hypothetical protein